MRFSSKCPHCGQDIVVSIFAESIEVSEPEKKAPQFDGFVYLIHSPTNNLYKIGRAKEIDSRYASIGKQSPVEVKLVHSFKSADSKKAERTLHHTYSHLRVLGEWFSLAEKDVSDIVSIGDYEL